jgi:glutamyl/glutaminyl-tRNA synthetase
LSAHATASIPVFDPAEAGRQITPEGSKKPEIQSSLKNLNVLLPLSLKESETSLSSEASAQTGIEVKPSEKREILSRDELIKMFTFDRVNKSSAVFDMKKLNWINSEYIKASDEPMIVDLLIEKLEKEKIQSKGLHLEYAPQQSRRPGSLFLKEVVRLMKERVSTINDFLEFGRYFFEEPVKYDQKGLTKHWNPTIKPVFEEYLTLLMSCSNWSAEVLEKDLRDFAGSKGIKAGELIHILRLSLTGMTISPGIFELMILLGNQTVVSRIMRFLHEN